MKPESLIILLIKKLQAVRFQVLIRYNKHIDPWPPRVRVKDCGIFRG